MGFRRLASYSTALIVVAVACSGSTETPTTMSSSTVPTTGVSSTTTSIGAPTFSGTTQPSTRTDAQLVVIGDWGSGTLPEGAIAGAIEQYASEHPVEAILTTGDNFYFDDAEFLMRPYEWVADTEIDWWVTWGNSDVESETRIGAVNDAFDHPPRWTVHEWGAVDVLILDSNQVTSLEQAAFFLDAMAISEKPMIVALHHPPYSCSHDGSTTDIVNQWVQVLDEDIILVLSGHDHSYQRFEEDGVAYIVTGGGGRALRPLSECPDNHPERLFGAELYHFLALEQTDDAILITAIDVNGAVFDEVSIPLP